MPIVCAAELSVGTFALLENDFQEGGHGPVPLDLGDLAAVEAALASRGSTVLYVEALSNPLLQVADLPSWPRSLTRTARGWRRGRLG